MNFKTSAFKFWATVPISVIVLGLFGLPALLLLSYGFFTRVGYGSVGLPLTLDNFRQVFEPLYLTVFFKSILVSLAVTAVTFVIGLGCAYYLAKCVTGRLQACLLFLLVLPFWTSSLARLYGWYFLLGASGPINRIALALGLLQEPRTFLFNGGAFFLGLLYNNLPYMVLPLYGVIAKIDDDVIQAGYDLYASEWALWRRVIIPLSAPGWLAGGALVFISALGDFVTVDVLYGSKSTFAANLIQSQFLTARNWPLGSAMTLVFLAGIAAVLCGVCLYLWRRLPYVFRRDQILAGLEKGVAL